MFNRLIIVTRPHLVVLCDFKSSKQLFEELIQSNRFAFTKWIPLYRKDYKYSQLITTRNAGEVLKLRKKPYVYFMHVNRPAYSFLVSLSYEATSLSS